MFKNSNSHATSNLSGFLMQNRGWITYGIMAIALTGFEMFNFSTTQYALNDLLGDLKFVGIQWATILSIAFCGIDFAGLARLFTPDEPNPTREVWYLFGAWMLAAIMNAILTWWGVSMALQGHPIQSTTIIEKKLMMQIVPIFVALMVWVTRILLIGSFSMAGRHTSAANYRPTANRAPATYRAPQPEAQPTQLPKPAAQPAQLPTPVSAVERSQPSAPARRPVQPAAPVFERQTSTAAPFNRPQPLIPTTPPASQRTTASVPVRPEPEYVSDSDSGSGASTPNPLPALRPMAVSARPAGENQERRF
jgi:hypothetical protein